MFSIVTPTKNCLDMVKRCVGSVRAQRHVSLEHIIRDAVSADGTAEWIKLQPDLAAMSEPDNGMYDAINRGWKSSKGEIICWLNSDEQYLPGALELVERFFQEHPEADAVFGDYILVNGTGKPVSARKEIPLRRWYVANGILYAQSCATFYRRSVLDRFGELDSSFRICADMEWVLRLLSGGAIFLHIPAFLSLFSITGENLSLRSVAMVEQDAISARYGALTPRVLRIVPRLCRWIEKALLGCYGDHSVRYRYIVDGNQNSTEYSAVVGSSWKWVAK